MLPEVLLDSLVEVCAHQIGAHALVEACAEGHLP